MRSQGNLPTHSVLKLRRQALRRELARVNRAITATREHLDRLQQRLAAVAHADHKAA